MRYTLALKVLLLCISVFTLLASTALAARDAGIDTSHYQGTITWGSVHSAGKDFAWTKADEGWNNSFNDSTFVPNMTNGTAAGVYMGAYHFARPETNTATADAAHFLAVAQPYIGSGYLRPVIDVESGNGTAVGSANLSDWVNTFVNYIVANGGGSRVEPIIYCNTNYAQSYFNSTVASRTLWIANYNYTESQALGTSNPPIGVFNNWSFWQYSSSLNVNGIGTNPVDTDAANGDINFVKSFVATALPEQFDINSTTAGSGVTSNGSYTWEAAGYSSKLDGTDPVAWVDGNILKLAAGTDAGTNNYTLTANSNHTVAGMLLQQNGGGTVTVNGPGVLSIASGDRVFYVGASTQNLKINASLAGSGRIIWGGSGSLFLLGNNTFTGGVLIETSTGLNFNNDNSFGTGRITWGTTQQVLADDVATAPVTLANPVTTNATQLIYVGPAAAPVTFTGAWTLASGSSEMTIGNTTHTSSKMIISGAIGGSGGALLKDGVGTLVLSGANTYTGGTTINAGTLQLGNGGTTGALSTSSTITNNANLIFNRTNAVTQGTDFSGSAISGTGTLTQAGTGTLVLNAANTYTGSTTISAGALQLGSGTTGKLSTSSAIINNSSLIFDRTNTVTQGTDFTGSAISGTGSLTQGGNGTLVLNAANTYTGKTFINAGTLSISSDGNLGAVPAFTTADQLTFVGSGATLQATAGLAINSKRGITFIKPGIIKITSGSLGVGSAITNTGGSTVTITGGGDFNPSANNSTTFTNGKWTITGGTRWLNANNDNNSGAAPASAVADFFTFDNGTYVNNGAHTLSANKGITLAAGGGTINTINGDMIFNGVISGPGSLTKLSANTLTLGGANIYAGTTTVSGGIVILSAASATLGSGNITVQGATAGTSLVIQSGVGNAISDSALLSLAGGGAIDVADQGYANLGTAISEIVGSLVLGGVAQADGLTFGSTSSGAVVRSDEYFAGTGTVSVGLPGDFNGDDSVDASDYVAWRVDQTTYGGSAGYDLWRSHFGQTAGSGSGASVTAAIPEPATLVLLMFATASWCLRRGRAA